MTNKSVVDEPDGHKIEAREKPELLKDALSEAMETARIASGINNINIPSSVWKDCQEANSIN